MRYAASIYYLLSLICMQATRAYLHAEEDVEAALNKSGFKVTRREMTSTQFYFSRLLEAKKLATS